MWITGSPCVGIDLMSLFARRQIMGQLIFRFLVGGLIVSFFAALGDVLKPKSFAGLFGAAPSVGLATLALTTISNGKMYAAIEVRSIAAGVRAFPLLRS